jgi:hypothetical protein
VSNKLVREAVYEMEGQNRTLRVKKWSARKWFAIVGDIGDLIEESMDQIKGADFTATMLMAKLIPVLCKSSDRVVRIIKESVDDPKLDEEEILEWDLEDFIGVLDKALEINLSKSMEKKMGRFRTRLGLGTTESSLNGSRESNKPSGIKSSS